MNAKQIEKDEKDFEQYLDEVWGDVNIAGIEFPTSTALKELDPIAFDVTFSDWSSEEDNQQWECGECGEIFLTEEEADDCCKEEQPCK